MPNYKQPVSSKAPVVGEEPVRSVLKRNVSAANRRSNEYDGVKTTGIKIRGTGAATKGVTARGPMG
jgi:hypothetical protein